MSILLSLKGYPGDATVTVCHSRTANLKELCLQADIIVAALGIPEFLKADMVKEGAVVIDVGTTRVAAPDTKRGWRLKGDVDFAAVAPKCSYTSRSEEHTSELQSRPHLVCRLLLEKKKNKTNSHT